MLVLVCYDITDDRRRLRVGSELENFGSRVQYSVFECHLEEPQLGELQARLLTLIDDQEDHVRYYVLCPKDEAAVLVDGLGGKTRDWLLLSNGSSCATAPVLFIRPGSERD